MRRAILPALLVLLFALPSSGQYSRYGGHADRDAQRTVARWYERFLDREPDPYSATWVQALRRGQESEQVLSGILGSDEYYRRAGSTPAGFVRQLYLDLTGQPDPARVGLLGAAGLSPLPRRRRLCYPDPSGAELGRPRSRLVGRTPRISPAVLPLSVVGRAAGRGTSPSRRRRSMDRA